MFATAQPNGQTKFVEALYDYEASQDGDLGFRSGDKIEIVKDCKWGHALYSMCVCAMCCMQELGWPVW